MSPGSNGITFHVLKLEDIEGTEEITYASGTTVTCLKKQCEFLFLKMNFRLGP